MVRLMSVVMALVVAIAGTSSLLAADERSVGATSAPSIAPAMPRPLKPGRSRPVIAVVGENTFTEVTDYIVPYSVLVEAGVADVVALGTKPGYIQMFPALKVAPQETVEKFDGRFPDGADYVVVPAVHKDDDPALIGWVQAQASKGAKIVGICDGVWVLANAGLLKGKRATGHWYSRSNLQKKFPETRWEHDKRYVVDGNIMTTTGVTASIPASLALVEEIAGRERAAAVAKTLGVKEWSSDHKDDDFHLKTNDIFTAAVNWLAFWSHETVAIPVSAGADEMALALAADAYSRTYRSTAYSVAPSNQPIKTRRGLVLLPDRIAEVAGRPGRTLAPFDGKESSAAALDMALDDIRRTYGQSTMSFVALQMEYPRQ